jgi:competence protein ComEC
MRERKSVLKLYFIDVGWGSATLIVSPSGQTMLIDTGQPSTAGRVLDVLKLAGIKRIDYLVITHYHWDHCGALTELAANIPIHTIVDHGEPNVELGKSDDWWKQRRQVSPPGIGKRTDEEYEAYLKVRDQHHHIVVKAGDRIPISGLDVDVVAAAYETISRPLKGAGAPSPACAKTELRPEEDAEDGQSIAVVVTYEKFRFASFSDITWNVEQRLFCPDNLVGTVDVYWITHHGQSYDRSYSDYYWGISSCPPAEVYGLRPRVSILSLGPEGHPRKGATPDVLKLLRSSPGMETIWQTNYVVGGGEKGHSAPEQFCANVGDSGDRAQYIKLLADPDGNFTVTNSRNGYTQQYLKRE